jgi:pentatricopeptide repeat protein
MKKSNIIPNEKTYLPIFKKLKGDETKISYFLNEMKNKNIIPNIFIMNCIINSFLKNKNYEKIISTLDYIKNLNLEYNFITYNIAIKALFHTHNFDFALNLFFEVKKNFSFIPFEFYYDFLLGKIIKKKIFNIIIIGFIFFY